MRKLVKVLLTLAVMQTVYLPWSHAADISNWQQRYQAFTTEVPNHQLFRYFQQIQLLDNWQPAEQCSAFHLKKLNEALSINPASLHLRLTRYNCWQQQQATVQIQQEEPTLIALAEVILQSGQGFLADAPIIVRELGDATALFELAEYNLLETEMLMRQQQLLVRLYLQDPQSGIYQYRYVSMFSWLSELMQRSGLATQSEQQVSAAAYQQYLQGEFDFALLYRAKQYIVTGQYAAAANILQPMVARSYLATTALAQLYLLQQNTTALDELLPELISAHEAGEPSASAMLALLVLTYDASDAALTEAQQLLDEYAAGTEAALRQEMLLDLISQHNNYQTMLRRWLGEAASDIQLDALQRVADLWQTASARQQQQRGLALQQLWLQLNNKKER